MYKKTAYGVTLFAMFALGQTAMAVAGPMAEDADAAFEECCSDGFPLPAIAIAEDSVPVHQSSHEEIQATIDRIVEEGAGGPIVPAIAVAEEVDDGIEAKTAALFPQSSLSRSRF